MTKPDAKLSIGVPSMVSRGSDINAFNAHRIYGPVMYPFLTTNWKFDWPTRKRVSLTSHLSCYLTCLDVDRVDTLLERDPSGYQPVFVFEKVNTGLWGWF